jgi:hypothetical protein
LWNESYEKLKTFKEEHGHCEVPQLYDSHKKRSLGFWVSAQRVAHRRGTLSPDRFAMLTNLGFAWIKDERYRWSNCRDVDRHEAQWQEHYESLVAFYKDYGHSLVPNLFIEGKIEVLGRWVRAQRTCHAEKTLLDHRKELLEKVSFVWVVLAKGQSNFKLGQWERMYSRLLEYREKHGDCLVSRDDPDNRELSVWVEQQRAALKDGSIHPRRIERLDAVGFLMTKDKFLAYWNKQFKKLSEYKKETGTTYVKHAGEGRLFRWTSAQRYLRRRNVLQRDHELKLDSIGFEWSAPFAHSPRVDKAPKRERKRPDIDELSDDETDSFSDDVFFGHEETLQETDSASGDAGSGSSENRASQSLANVETVSRKRRLVLKGDLLAN